MDRADVGDRGNLDDVTIVCRNLFDAPKKRCVARAKFSTVVCTNRPQALPGNLWAR